MLDIRRSFGTLVPAALGVPFWVSLSESPEVHVNATWTMGVHGDGSLQAAHIRRNLIVKTRKIPQTVRDAIRAAYIAKLKRYFSQTK